MLAGVACGVFADFDAAAEKCTRIRSRTEPDGAAYGFYQEQAAVYEKIHDVLEAVYHL